MNGEIKSKALERLHKKMENEIAWLYIAYILKETPSSIVEVRNVLKEKFDIKINTFNLYSIIYRMEREGLVKRKREGEPTRYYLTEHGDLIYRKALLYLEEKLLLLKQSLSK